MVRNMTEIEIMTEKIHIRNFFDEEKERELLAKIDFLNTENSNLKIEIKKLTDKNSKFD